MLSIEQSCYWLAQRTPRDPMPLESRRDAEVAIVGAGLTGLWTALFLKGLDPGVEVAVVEQGMAAYGASGRNAGMLSETLDHSHGLAIEHFGGDEARRLAQLGQANVTELVEFLDHRNIQCDYQPSGRLMVALTNPQVEEAGRTVELARRLGLDSFRLLDREGVRAQLDCALYLGGVWVTGGGILDPVKLVDGLRVEAERIGIRVYEESRVQAVERAGAGVRVRTAAGRIEARRAVLATSAYTHHLLPGTARRFIPLYDYILVSDPLTAGQREMIGWRRRQGVTDGRTFFNYYRLTADDRILWGTSEATYYRGNRVDPSCDHSPAHYAALRRSFRRHFPALHSLEFPYAWEERSAPPPGSLHSSAVRSAAECSTAWGTPAMAWVPPGWPAGAAALAGGCGSDTGAAESGPGKTTGNDAAPARPVGNRVFELRRGEGPTPPPSSTPRPAPPARSPRRPR